MAEMDRSQASKIAHLSSAKAVDRGRRSMLRSFASHFEPSEPESTPNFP